MNLVADESVDLTDIARKERIALVVETIEMHFEKLQYNFSVLSKNGLRIKTKGI